MSTIEDVLIGDTLRISWISSLSTSIDSSYAAVFNGSESLVDSAVMVESGSNVGHWYHDHTVPDTPGFYVAETHVTINGKPYKNRVRYQAVTGEVD